jgi:hypothetical protein
MASGREMRTVSSKQKHQQSQQQQQQQQQHTVSGIRLAPIESSDSSATGARKKRLTKKRRKSKSTFLPTKLDRFSSDDESEDVDKKLSKVVDDGFVSYESNSSGRSLVDKVKTIFIKEKVYLFADGVTRANLLNYIFVIFSMYFSAFLTLYCFCLIHTVDDELKIERGGYLTI